MERYELIDHTADVMVRCTGRDLEECFANAAYALFDQVIDATKVEWKETQHVEVEGIDLEDAFYSFLSEMLFILDCDGKVFNSFDVRIDGLKVSCDARGEPLDKKRHHAKSDIKAVTYHMLSVRPDVPEVTVIFDV